MFQAKETICRLLSSSFSFSLLITKGQGNWTCLACRRLREDLIDVSKYLKGRSQKDAARHCSVMTSSRMKLSGQKLMDRRFHLNMRENIFTVQVTEHWSRLPRKVMESLSLEMFQKAFWTQSCITSSKIPCVSREIA